MDLTYCLAFIIICLSLVRSPVRAEDVCVQKTACSCEFANGTGMDLTPSAKLTFFTTQDYHMRENNTQYELATYFYHPCYDTQPSVNPKPNSTTTCNLPLSICRHRSILQPYNSSNGTFKFTEDIYEFMGSSNVTKFSPDGHSIVYINGPSLAKDTVTTTVMLVCAESDDKLDVFSADDPRHIVLSFYSRNACLRQIEEVGRSTGSTLLIIFFSIVVLYLVLGVCTKKFLMGATGVEVVPNLAFWSDLPNLVKDGWAFTLNGFKLPARGPGPVTTPDPNSYDSI